MLKKARHAPPPTRTASRHPRAFHEASAPSTLQRPTLRSPKVCPKPPSPRRVRKKAPDFAREGDYLESTPVQQLQVWGFFGLVAAAFAQALSQSSSTGGLLSCAGAFVAGWLFADLGTGFYHWAVDNYGDGDTPVVGPQIAAFQGHHRAPQTIAQREFANNLYRLTVPTAPQLLALLAARPPPALEMFAASALAFIVLSQEFHRQAHAPRSAPFMRKLQKAGVCLPKSMHAQHHASPFGVNYCIVSGVWNGLLDDSKVFRRLEVAVFRSSGTEPIAWQLDPELKRQALNL